MYLGFASQAAAVNAYTTAKMALDCVSHKTKIDVFENAFRKIKEVSKRPAEIRGDSRNLTPKIRELSPM